MSNRKIDAAYLSANPLPYPDEGGDKHSRGRVLIIAGSVEVPGAALLAGLGALRSGAGVLQMATCKSNAAHLGMAMPEAMIVGCRETASGEIDPLNSERLVDLANDADAVLLGPGLVDEAPVARASLRTSEPSDRTRLRSRRFGLHVAEDFARTLLHSTGAGPSSLRIRERWRNSCRSTRKKSRRIPLAAARSAAGMLDAVVAMKGASTYVVLTSGRGYCSSSMGLPLSEPPGRETSWRASSLAWLREEPNRCWRRRGPSIYTAMPAAGGWNTMGSWACWRGR